MAGERLLLVDPRLIHTVRAIVVAHGGVVSLITGAGAGTTVWVELPRARVAAAAVGAAASSN
jgi:hypothetical protein